MFDSQTFFAFLAASIVIILAPGPAQALVLARSLGEGRSAGIMTAVGLNVGTIFHAVAAGLGLSAVLATSALAFSAVKYAGAAYLIYLGIRAILTTEATGSTPESEDARPGNAFGTAVFTGILNPKVAIFFLAFLPQFVDPDRGPAFVQFVILGSIIAVIDIAYESILACIAGGLGDRFMNDPRVKLWRERVTGIALVALGVRLALTRRG